MRQQFTGQQRDAETGLDYFWARNMAAKLGRFLSMDPSNAGASHGSPQSWNAFGYVSNNPLRMVDPDGRCGADVSIVYRDAYGNPIGFDFSQSEACFTVDVWDTAANNGDITRLYFPDELEYCQTFGCDPYDNRDYGCEIGYYGSDFGCDEGGGGGYVESLSEKTHLALALAGLVPAWGVIPDGLDLLLSLLEGDLASAKWSLAGIVPGLGQGARFAQYGRRLVRNSLHHAVARGAERLGMTAAQVTSSVNRLNNRIQAGQIRYYYLGTHGDSASVAFDLEGGYAVYVYRSNGTLRLNTIYGSEWNGIEKYTKIDAK